MRAIAILLTLLATPALADVLPITGIYGNAEGCRFYFTGEVKGDLMVLTPDTMTAPVAQCDFDALASSTATSFTIAAVCSGSGDFSGHPDMVTVSEGGAAGYFVTVAGLPELGPFIPCRNFSKVQV